MTGNRRLECISILFIILIGLLLLLPLFRPGILVTDDGSWMVIRLSAFFQSLREGQFPVRFLGRLNNGYGYPVANFLYPGFLYIGSVFRSVGFSFQTAVELIFSGSFILGGVAIYGWLRHFFGRLASITGSVSFLLSPYLLYDIFTRGSVGEVLAIGMCALCVYAVEKKLWWLLSPGIALLTISHNTLALFFLGAVFLYITACRKHELFIPYFIGIGMASFYIFPLLLERKFVRFDSVQISDPFHYFGASYILLRKYAPIVIGSFILVWSTARGLEKEKRIILVLLFGALLFSSELTGMFWHSQSFAKFIQFPYRFYAIVTVFSPWVIAWIVQSWKGTRGALFGAISIAFFLYWALPYQKAQSIVMPEGFYTTNEATTTVRDEYMPIWVEKTPAKRPDELYDVVSGNAFIEPIVVNSQTRKLRVNAKEKSELQIYTVYYPGWGALLNETAIPIAYNNPYGFMRVVLPEGEHTLFMAFRETKSRFVADIFSLLFLLMYIIFVVFRRNLKSIVHSGSITYE